MKPIIIYSNKFLNFFSWFFRVGGMSLFPVVILREYYKTGIREPFTYVDQYWLDKGKTVVRHETIHFKQQLELLVIPFYVLYILNFVVNVFVYWNIDKAYRNICFEREAYSNEDDVEYLNNRKLYAWISYLT